MIYKIQEKGLESTYTDPIMATYTTPKRIDWSEFIIGLPNLKDKLNVGNEYID